MTTLADYASSDKQRQAVVAFEKHGNLRAAANEVGIHRTTLREHIRKVKTLAAAKGWSPDHDMVKTVPDPFIVKGTSTLYGPEGEQKLQWVKTSIEHEKLIALMREVVDEMKSDVKPIRPIKLQNKVQNADLLNLFVLSDAHIGMLAWHEDGDDDWDVEIAEKTIMESFTHLVKCSPDAKHAVFAQLGDGLHSDGMKPVTPGHGHILDADSRFPKIVRAAIRIFRRVINMLLEKHQTVTVVMAQGNHDPSGSVWLQEFFAVLYENNKRVNVLVSPKPYYAIEHGDVLLGFHHGHCTKANELSDVFTGEFRQAFGRTRQLYIHSGHFHSTKVIECNSAIVEQHTTLAARDSHSSSNGYRSLRSMKAITYHKTKLKLSEVSYNV